MEKTPLTPEDFMAMPDEDIANLTHPPVVDDADPVDDTANDKNSNNNDTEDPSVNNETQQNEEEAEETQDKIKTDEEIKVDGVHDSTDNNDPHSGGGVDAVSDQKVEPKKDPEEAAKPKATESTEVINYENLYKQIMTPFKANGKTIELRSAEEAISLMQMGANYTRKMQDIKPHRKTLMMLENHDLLDPNKLSHLIDVSKGDKEAIKKLIKDTGVDILDIDTSEDPQYFGGANIIGDEEANFKMAVDELTSTDAGRETAQIINDKWDTASKDILWESPEIMQVINQQRESGIYDIISNEIDRRRTVGQISPDIPFLQAYKDVGDVLMEAGAFNHLVASTNTDTNAKRDEANTGNAPVVVATRTAAPKDPVTNSEKVEAAAPTRNTPRQTKQLVNPLAMPDDEFLQTMQNRL